MAKARRQPLPQSVHVSSTMTIEELTGRAGGKPRRLVLAGAALPLQGAEWGSQLVMKTTWFPGNAAEATQQVLVPIEMPSAWQGMWRRTTLGSTPCSFTDESGETSSIIDPHVLRLVFEDIHRSGAKLRVTWAVSGTQAVGDPDNGDQRPVDVKIVREGRCKEFSTPIERHTDIQWHATFEWSGRGASQNRVANVSGTSDVEKASNAFQSSVLALTNATEFRIVKSQFDIRKSADTFTLGQLEQIAELPKKTVETFTRKLQQVVGDMKRVADLSRKLALAPFVAYGTMVDFARNSVYTANAFLDDMSRIPVEIASNGRKVRDLVRASKYTGRTVQEAFGNVSAASDLASAVGKVQVTGANRGALSVRESASTRAGDILAMHVCKTGDTPQTLSRRYYASAERGVDILKANRLPWYTPTFHRGQIVVIPSLAGNMYTEANSPRA